VQQLTTRGWRKLKSVLYPLPPRARNDYATHVPVLIGLASLRRIERVLELGCGNYSTKTFLNRAAFPHLKELRSLENDPLWARTIALDVAGDSRCTIAFTPDPIADGVATLDLDYFDLIFVDDSASSEQRTVTIETLSALHPQNPWLVIHDYEFPDYQRAAADFAHKFTFNAYNPETGLVFNSLNQKQTELKQLNHRLKANSSRLEPDDVASWLRVLRK
jgi:hypothetical protein